MKLGTMDYSTPPRVEDQRVHVEVAAVHRAAYSRALVRNYPPLAVAEQPEFNQELPPSITLEPSGRSPVTIGRWRAPTDRDNSHRYYSKGGTYGHHWRQLQ
jgi:hypothetical protein